MFTSLLLSVQFGKIYRINAVRQESAKRQMVKRICFRVCWYAPIVATIYGIISIRQITILSILTVQDIIKAAERFAHQLTIRVDFLEQVVLGEIRRLTKFATQYETEFAQIVMGHSIKAAEQEQRMKQKELNSLMVREKELDTLFEKIYEDNVSGKISDERFSKLSVKYDTEQKELNIRVKELEDELAKKQNKSVSTDMFITSVRKYTRARKLTTKMLNELIEKIEVYQAEEIDGKRIQRLKIHYNCIGSIDEIPNIDKLPENNVSVHTRQGVDIHYAACAG